MKFNDEVIAHVAKILQMAIITGTDIVDHLRMVVLEEKDNQLFLNEDYSQNYDSNIEQMISEIMEAQQNTEVGD